MIPTQVPPADVQTPTQQQEFMGGLAQGLLQPKIEGQEPSAVAPASLEEALQIIQAQQAYIQQLEGMQQQGPATEPVEQAQSMVSVPGQT